MNFEFNLSDLLLISPLIVVFLTSLIPITAKVLRGNKEMPAVATLTISLTGLMVSAFLLVVFSGSNQTAFSQTLVFDGVTQWVGLTGLIAAAISIVMMHENPATSGRQFSELVFLALSSVLGMLVLVSALDLLTIFIGLELMSLAIYLMIGMSHEEKFSKEAALKYFVLGSFASALYLYGVSFVFGTTGTTNIFMVAQQTGELIQSNRLFLVGTTLIIVGFCFKVSIAPFHAWTPDVYQGAPTPHAAFMATAIKAVSFAAFLRVIATKSLVFSDGLFELLQWLAVITMLVGNVAAIIQNNFKRMLAYSSISHSGYLIVGLITSGISDVGAFGASGVLFYLLSYSFMTLGCFAVVAMLEKNENSTINIDDLAGLAQRNPVLAACLSVFLLSLAGMPPFIGFFGKFYIFNAAIGEGLLWLAVWGVINSVISVYYYLRPIVLMYMREGAAEVAERRLVATTVTVIVSAVFVSILGLFSGPIFSAVEKSLLN